MGQLLLLAVGALALIVFASEDDKPKVDCYQGLDPQKKAVAKWFLEAPLGTEAPEWVRALSGPEFADQLTISSKTVAFLAGEAEDLHPQLSACLFKRAAQLAEQERQKGGA